MRTTWDELRDKGYASMTDLCRDLVRQEEEYHMGGGPGQLKKVTIPEKIEVYRGDMLCLTVHDVYKAAKLMPTSEGFKPYQPFPSKRAKLASESPVETFK